MPTIAKCINFEVCGKYIINGAGLCSDCRDAAQKLNALVNRKTDEDIITELTEKPKDPHKWLNEWTK